jgi:hypothetical protein
MTPQVQVMTVSHFREVCVKFSFYKYIFYAPYAGSLGYHCIEINPKVICLLLSLQKPEVTGKTEHMLLQKSVIFASALQITKRKKLLYTLVCMVLKPSTILNEIKSEIYEWTKQHNGNIRNDSQQC